MTFDPEVIRLALSELDSANDDHWTTQGLPRVEVVSKAVGAEVSRQDITDAAPKFVRHGSMQEEATEATLAERIAEAEEAEEAARAEMERAKRRFLKAQGAADALREERDKTRNPKVESALAIRAALAQSARERAERAERRAQLRAFLDTKVPV